MDKSGQNEIFLDAISYEKSQNIGMPQKQEKSHANAL